MQIRVHWIDVAKGMLILMVVFFHLPILTHPLTDNADALAIMQSVSSIYVPFFIPAFFVITGMCSNFSNTPKDFLFSNVKHLIVPMLTLSLLARIIGWKIYNWSDFCSIEGWSFAVVGYFMLSLLISKTIYFYVHYLLSSVYWRGGITLVFLLIGIVLNKWGIYNLVYFENALIFTFFVWLGDFLRNRHWESLAKYCVIVYLLIWSCLSVCHIGIPHVMLSICVSYLKIPLYILLSVLGCLAVLWVARLISSSRILEDIGKNSLIIYFFHSAILLQLCSVFSQYITISSIWKFIFFEVLLFLFVILLCQVVGRVLSLPYLKCLIGKF